MSVSVTSYCYRLRNPPILHNRKELWRANANGTGDAGGGSVDLAIYFPQGFSGADLKLFPDGMHFVLEQLKYGCNIAAAAFVTLIVGNVLEDYVATAGASGVIGGASLTAGYGGTHILDGQIKSPFYLGARRAWSLDSPLFVLRTANVDTKKFDSTIWISVWDGVPKDLFTERYK